MLKRLRRSRSLRIVAAAAAAGALLAPPQFIGAQTPAAAISSIAIVSSPADSASYQAGETIGFSVQFTSAVRVAGSPVLVVDVGGMKRRALFDSVRGSEALFAYPVTGDDVDTDGVSVGASALTLGAGGAVTDSQGLPLETTPPSRRGGDILRAAADLRQTDGQKTKQFSSVRLVALCLIGC